MTVSPLNRTRLIDLDRCNVWLHADDDLISTRQLDSVYDALDKQSASLNEAVRNAASAQPGVTDQQLDTRRIFTYIFRLPLEGTCPRLILNLSTPFNLDRRSMVVVLHDVVSQLREADFSEALAA